MARGTWTSGSDEIAARLAEVDAEQRPGQISVLVPETDDTGDRSSAGTAVSRCDSSEDVNDDCLERVVGPSEEITGYRVLIAGDWLGTIERVAFRTKVWQTANTNRTAMPHVGSGRYAANREAAVGDLLTGLGVA